MNKAAVPASPSASILLISPTNEILLLRRVQTSTSFASGHVFPGGHLSPQDGDIYSADDVRRHEDGEAYRMAAIRECFEESGILLAKSIKNPEELLVLSDEEREQGRHAIHQEKISFQEWVKQRNGVPDIDHLIPFTRWLTPSHLPKRFTTQMYLYFLPLNSPKSNSIPSPSSPSSPSTQSPPSPPLSAHIPTPDGGIEHTTANFLPPETWLSHYANNEIILFFPQFYLLTLISPFLSPFPPNPNPNPNPASTTPPTLQTHRTSLIDFITSTSHPPWGLKCISSFPIFEDDEMCVNALGDPGPELQGTERRGDEDRLGVLYKRRLQGRGESPRFGLIWKSDFLEGKEGLLVEMGRGWGEVGGKL